MEEKRKVILYRKQISLNGEWQFQLDHKQIGEEQEWFDPKTDAFSWLYVCVPSVWDNYNYGLKGYEGTCWYRREFEIDMEKAEKKVRLCFAGVNHAIKAWINGEYIGSHEGPYTPFEFDISDKLKNKNVLIARVENLQIPHRVPEGSVGWWNYGGIYRDVSLQITNCVYIQDLFIRARPSEGRRGHIEVTAKIDPGDIKTEKIGINFAVYGPDGEIVLNSREDPGFQEKLPTSGIERHFGFDIEEAQLWDTNNPTLYQLILYLEIEGDMIDVVKEHFGIREIAIKEGRLTLNGQPIFIKGVNRHEEYPNSGKVDPGNMLESDLRMIKYELGCNFVRTSHYPNEKRFYELADRIGLLVETEIPFYYDKCTAEKISDSRAIVNGKQQIQEMIGSLKNHPSIIVWVVANEINSEIPEARDTIKEFMDAVKRLDRTRLISHVNDHGTRDVCTHLDDIICVNEYIGVFEAKMGEDEARKHLSSFLENMHRKFPEKPILVTEFGCLCNRGIHGNVLGSEEMQVAFFRWHYPVLKSKDYVAGAVVWAFADYMHGKLQESAPKSLINDPISAWGLVDFHRNKKQSFDVMAQFWNESSKD